MTPIRNNRPMKQQVIPTTRSNKKTNRGFIFLSSRNQVEFHFVPEQFCQKELSVPTCSVSPPLRNNFWLVQANKVSM
jgi:hypothetical protein